jgi:hypothetical protein
LKPARTLSPSAAPVTVRVVETDAPAATLAGSQVLLPLIPALPPVTATKKLVAVS